MAPSRGGGVPLDLALPRQHRRFLRRCAAPRPMSTPESPEPDVDLGPPCPECGEPWLRPTNMPGRYRCVYCLSRFELVSLCPNCGEHSTIVRMSSTAVLKCNHCGD